jgi:adenosylmethionine-8-amino-7-oxononanoate aminotransferase
MRIAQDAFANGLIVYPCSGNVNGVDGDTLIVAPPYNIRDAECEELITTLVASTKRTLLQLNAP